MRPDMSKVIVERPRGPRGPSVGSAYPRGSLEARWAPDLENAPRLEAMGRAYGTKYLRENLQPLVRYLRSNVERLWNDVHSEIAAHISCSSAVQKHVLDHLRDMVHTHVWLEGGAPFYLRYDRVGPLVSGGGHPSFYVCPESRRLKIAPYARRKPNLPSWRKPDPDRVPLGKMRELRRIGGIWYELTLAPLPYRMSDVGDCYDVLARSFVDPAKRMHCHNPIWWSGRYVVKKLQLNSREIALHRLPRSS